MANQTDGTYLEMHSNVKGRKEGCRQDCALVDKALTSATVIDIKFINNDLLHGFSTFVSPPGSKDHRGRLCVG